MLHGAIPRPAWLFVLMALLLLPLNANARNLFSTGVAADYATGDYGTGQTTDTYSTSLYFGYYPTERFDVSLSASYLYQSSRATTSSGGIIFERRDRDTTNGSGPGSGPGSPSGGDTFDEEASSSGFGDLYLNAGYKILLEGEGKPQLRAIGYVKIPTADEDEGLGTGELDFSLGLEMRKWIDKWNPHVRATRVFQGDNDTLQLEDFYTYEAGIGYLVKSDQMIDLSFWGATEPADGSDSQAEARLKFTKWNDNDTGWSAYISAGLVEGSHDFGGGGSFFVNF